MALLISTYLVATLARPPRVNCACFFALQPTAGWAVIIGLLLLIRREFARDRALAIAALPK